MVDEAAPIGAVPPAEPGQDPGDVYAAWLEGDLDGAMFGETGHEVVGRLRSVVEDAADRFRGETVLLVSHGGIIGSGCRASATSPAASSTTRQRGGRGAGRGLRGLALHPLGRPGGGPLLVARSAGRDHDCRPSVASASSSRSSAVGLPSRSDSPFLASPLSPARLYPLAQGEAP